MTNPLFSIIVPLYNKRATIERTIKSITIQPISNYEVIIVDDGSTDGSKDFVETILPPNGYCLSKPNGGVSSARNYGIENSKGEWLLFLDADDELTKDSLHIFSKAILMNPLHKIIVAGEIYKRKKCEKYRYRRYSAPLFYFWINKIHPRPGALLVHKSLFLARKGFDERMSFFEDTEFALRIMDGNQVATITKPSVIYHQEPGGLSGSSHSIEKEMAFYIPEFIEHVGFWYKALLYENLEMEILWWQQHGNVENAMFYRNMQKKYFSRIFKLLHCIRQKMVRSGLI